MRDVLKIKPWKCLRYANQEVLQAEFSFITEMSYNRLYWRGSGVVPLPDADAAMLHGVDDMFFYNTARHPEAFGDFRVRQAFDLAQQKTLAARRR